MARHDLINIAGAADRKDNKLSLIAFPACHTGGFMLLQAEKPVYQTTPEKFIKNPWHQIFTTSFKRNTMKKDNEKQVPRNELSDEIDSPEDRKKMQADVNEVTLPDEEEIAGQEQTHPAASEGAHDAILSEDREAGESMLSDGPDQQAASQESDVGEEEKRLLATAATDSPGDDQSLRDAALDSTDEDGTPLNEDSFDKNISPSDLDVPGAGLDDDEEQLGEEDEENNEYSLGGDRHADDAPRDEF